METWQTSRLWLAPLAAALLAASPVLAEQLPPKPRAPSQAQVPMPNSSQIGLLIRTSLLTLNDAVQTGNFTVLRDRGAPSFRGANDAARLTLIFQQLVRDRVDISSIAVLSPQLIEAPYFDAQNRLHVTGYFAASPSLVNFTLVFEASGGRWCIFGISVNPAPTETASTNAPKRVSQTRK